MPRNIYGGGARTNENGLKFEQETSLKEALNKAGYNVIEKDVFLGNVKVAISAGKHNLYRLLESYNINYENYISKKMLPDEALFIPQRKLINIIEKKFQNCSGSVDEKLQTCDFKKTQYEKLFNLIDIKVEYIYVLNDWFKKEEYKDVLEYIIKKGCRYYFNTIPINELKLEDDTTE